MRDGSTAQQAKILKLREVRVFASAAPWSRFNRIRMLNEAKRAILEEVKEDEYFAFEQNPTVVFQLVWRPAIFVPDARGEEYVRVIRDIMDGEEMVLTDPGLLLEEMPGSAVRSIRSTARGAIRGLGSLLNQLRRVPSHIREKRDQLKQQIGSEWDKAKNWDRVFDE
jgi:hypothetical protein